MNKTIELTVEETKTLGIILRSFINAEEAERRKQGLRFREIKTNKEE